jgi:hypothetical protein
MLFGIFDIAFGLGGRAQRDDRHKGEHQKNHHGAQPVRDQHASHQATPTPEKYLSSG